MIQINKIASASLLFTFLGVMFFSLFFMSAGMEMGQGMSDCMFMSHEDMMCPMSVIEHLNAWQSMFLSVSPAFVSILMILLVISVIPIFFQKVYYTTSPQILPYLHQRKYNFCHRPLQELFSNGILHPKVF